MQQFYCPHFSTELISSYGLPTTDRYIDSISLIKRMCPVKLQTIKNTVHTYS